MDLSLSLWQKCLDYLQDEILPKEFNTWIRPLQVELNGNNLLILAPNRHVLDEVRENFFDKIKRLVAALTDPNKPLNVQLEIGSKQAPNSVATQNITREAGREVEVTVEDELVHHSNLNPNFTFNTFVEGKSNQLARAAALQVADNPGTVYNPLYIYGGVGLGKTHLMHAVGDLILQKNINAKVVYLHSERFVADMISALRHNTINEFKRYYRTVNALLIDDIQFFAGKERSQEELFHTFNALFDSQQQIILTCDRYPKAVDGVEERLRSRFNWGLVVAVEPPELETRVAILKSKAEQSRIDLPDDVAFFIGKCIQSNVRELEGALKRVIAYSHFKSHAITQELAREALKDLLALQAKLVTIENIQKLVAEYYKIKVTDLLSKRRNRSIARPRQMAMLLAVELTNHSLPEIGEAFGGRDHTTVLHARRVMKELIASSISLSEDHRNLLRVLSA